MSESHLRITLVRSPIGTPKTQRETLVGLGLKRVGRPVIRPNTPSFRGMVKKVIHLVSVEETSSAGAAG
ncbi:MAG: 50S ribosomal protein L30 [bacterium]